MKKRTKLKTALFLLAAATNMTYASESGVPPKKGQTPLDVLECFQRGFDSYEKRISKLEKDNQAQQRIIKEQDMLYKGMIVYNSVTNEAQGEANTVVFWQISYHDRFKVKGVPDLRFNYYNPTLYQKGAATYIDVVEDLEGKVAIMMKATAEGIDPKTMKMINPKFLEGDKGVFVSQFASGWASYDYDGDTFDTNCAKVFAKITQHYSNCWHYNLGSDADLPNPDWGPHLRSQKAHSLNLKTDGSKFTRVRRITRYVIF